jgi:hypothetical protein
VEIAKYKALVVGHSAKVVMYDQMLQNQGEELFIGLNEA